MAKFKRILLKLSGESLMGEQGYGIDVKRLNEYAAQIKEALEMGVQISINFLFHINILSFFLRQKIL